MIFSLLLVFWIRFSMAGRCASNPCQLGVSPFIAPHYSCIDSFHLPDLFYCTCPDGAGRMNSLCRLCDKINCGVNGHCLEGYAGFSFLPVCGCRDHLGYYVQSDPCPNLIPTTTVAPKICLNNGILDSVTNNCICTQTFTGTSCELPIGQALCRNIVCVNGGVCNVVPTANNAVETQCWCTNGFAGSNCELIGTSTSCSSNLCQNGGTCDEKKLGSSTFAYCLCPAGFTGRLCEERYFTCSVSGLFVDKIHCRFGRYFQCLNNTLITQTCPKGFQYDSTTKTCAENVSCS